MNVLEHLEPKEVFTFFEEISNIPRGSGNEKAISDYIVNFAKKRGLYYRQDKANNVLITKKGTLHYETAPTLIIQGHMDMVCEKNADTKHDFLVDPLELKVEGDYVSAKGTTLGADNGIAVAYALALLDSDTIVHPPLEVIITTDEEVGMQGAYAFDASDLKGKLFLNLDSEEEGKFLVSCCGGKRATIILPIERETIPQWGIAAIVKIKGLKGGHSGTDIHLQRANANKLLARVLSFLNEQYDIRIATINGGSMDNAICREAEAAIAVKKEDFNNIKQTLKEIEETFQKEYRDCDDGITILFDTLNESVEKVLTVDTAEKAISVLILIPYGVVTVNLAVNGLVESSSNIGIVKTNEDSITFASAVRSSVISRKYMIFDEIKSIAKLVGGKAVSSSEYPAWEYNPDSKLLKLFQEVYQDIYQKEADVEAIHAGLECGLFAQKVEGLDLISMGPNMYDVHTPDEKISISSVVRVWDFLKEVLKRIK